MQALVGVISQEQPLFLQSRECTAFYRVQAFVLRTPKKKKVLQFMMQCRGKQQVVQNQKLE